jgi:hypothetical protein
LWQWGYTRPLPSPVADTNMVGFCRRCWRRTSLNAEKSPNGWTWELATDRLFLQWGLVVVATALLARACTGPKALEWLKDYQGATFRLTKYTAGCADWRCDHCAGCWAKFAEYDGSGILHEAYVSGLRPDETLVDGAALIFVCVRCFNQCCDSLDFEVESWPTSAVG